MLAHAFLNFMLDEKNAYDNFVQFNGYIPPQNDDRRRRAVKQGLIPKTLAAAVVAARAFAVNQELLSAQRRGLALWDNAWSKFRAGLRLMEARWIWRAARASRRRLALPLLPGRALRRRSPSRSATRTRSPSPCRSGTRSTGTSATCSRCSANIWNGGQFLTSSCARSRYVGDRPRALARSIGYPVAYYAARHAGRWQGARPARCSCCRSGSTT